MDRSRKRIACGVAVSLPMCWKLLMVSVRKSVDLLGRPPSCEQSSIVLCVGVFGGVG